MSMLANLAITGAVTAQMTTALQLVAGPCESIALQANFTYGSGGTTVSAWIQTSLDGGATWCDVANFSFTTASAREVMNLSALTTATTPQTPTDGSLAASTAPGVPIGSHWRVKYTTTGTYAGGTTLRIDAQPNRGRFTSLV
jgi:hypothetical protein